MGRNAVALFDQAEPTLLHRQMNLAPYPNSHSKAIKLLMQVSLSKFSLAKVQIGLEAKVAELGIAVREGAVLFNPVQVLQKIAQEPAGLCSPCSSAFLRTRDSIPHSSC